MFSPAQDWVGSQMASFHDVLLRGRGGRGATRCSEYQGTATSPCEVSHPALRGPSRLKPGTAGIASLHPRPDALVEPVSDSLRLLLFLRATRAVPASRAPWESRGPEVHRSVAPLWLPGDVFPDGLAS